MTPVSADPNLLAVVRRVLSQHNFRVQETRLDGLDDIAWLLAESESFVLGVAAGQTLDDLLVLEGYVAAALGELIQGSELGAKRWDSYVVLLASSDKDRRGSPEVVRLQYNTRSLRRLVALGTAAHEDAVAAALATFMPLPRPPPGGLPSAFNELVAQLVINGIPEDRAASVVGDYRSTGGIHGA
jgi:hypothetical protein